MLSLEDWLKRKPTGPKPKTRIASMSKKRTKEAREYARLRKKFLTPARNCEALVTILLAGNTVRVEKGDSTLATEIHHREGRGKNLNNTSTWLAVCRPCHRWIHQHPSKARALGLLK